MRFREGQNESNWNVLGKNMFLKEACWPLCRSGQLWIEQLTGLSPGWRHSVMLFARHFTLTVPLSTQMYKWVPANLMLGVTLK